MLPGALSMLRKAKLLLVSILAVTTSTPRSSSPEMNPPTANPTASAIVSAIASNFSGFCVSTPNNIKHNKLMEMCINWYLLFLYYIPLFDRLTPDYLLQQFTWEYNLSEMLLLTAFIYLISTCHVVFNSFIMNSVDRQNNISNFLY